MFIFAVDSLLATQYEKFQLQVYLQMHNYRYNH